MSELQCQELRFLMLKSKAPKQQKNVIRQSTKVMAKDKRAKLGISEHEKLVHPLSHTHTKNSFSLCLSNTHTAHIPKNRLNAKCISHCVKPASISSNNKWSFQGYVSSHKRILSFFRSALGPGKKFIKKNSLAWFCKLNFCKAQCRLKNK